MSNGRLWLLFLVAALILSVVAWVVRKQGRGAGDRGEAWPFSAKRPLTRPEQVLFYRLVKALPGCIVLAQVHVPRFLEVNTDRKDFYAWFNKINQLSVDFLVCRKDFSIMAAVELDDSSHARRNRMEADARKSRALAAAGVRLVRWRVGALPDEPAIQAAIGWQQAAADTAKRAVSREAQSA